MYCAHSNGFFYVAGKSFIRIYQSINSEEIVQFILCVKLSICHFQWQICITAVSYRWPDYWPICKEKWQHVNVDRRHLVYIVKHKRVSEDERRPCQRSIGNTKHHHEQAAMMWCQPRWHNTFQLVHTLVTHIHTHKHRQTDTHTYTQT